MQKIHNSISLSFVYSILIFFAISCSNNNPSSRIEDAKKTVSETYQTLLKRDPDPEGLKYFTDLLMNGYSLGDIENSIRNSEEFKNIK